MATDTIVDNLIINKLTQAQFDAIPEAERSDTELYFITDAKDSSLPDQTDNAGKFLTTDGTNASWGNAITSTAKSDLSLCIGGNDTTSGQPFSVWIGLNSGPENIYASNSLAVGNYAKAGSTAVALGADSSAKNNGISIGYYAVSTYNAIQLGGGTNNDENTFKVSNENGNFEMMGANGTIPTDRYTTTPTTAGTYVPKLTIAEDGTATREWGTESGGGDYLPLSGGTLTGSIGFSALSKTYEIKPTSYGNLYFRIDGVDIVDIEQGAGLLPSDGGKFSLGRGGRDWKNVYTAKLNNGADLIVPTEGGTIARVEDINAAVGDISTALTAILGE